MLVAIVTSLFPRPANPHSGWPVYKTVQALQRYTDLKVICPEPSYEARNHDVAKDWEEYKPNIIPLRFSFPAVKLLSRPFNGAITAKYLEPILRDLRPDLILSYYLYPDGFAAVRVGHALGIPTIVESLGSDLRLIPDPLTRLLVARTVRRADFVLTVSEDLRQRAIHMGAAPQRTKTIINGCDSEIFHFRNRQEARRELQLDEHSDLILYVGRFARPKGLMELCEALSVLAAERPNIRLALIGYGSFPAMTSCLRRHGLEKRVINLGRQNSRQVALWMQAANLFCLPSYSEGCPNVIVEATACGCPVVSTTVGGIPEIVGPDCSILVPPRDTSALLQGLRDALGREWDRGAIARRNGRTWDNVARETWEICQKLH
jgi:teichuronic acid biosynthesis glycosyltransferase TuaC